MLINLGTPEAPTAAALKPYLKQFLSDPRVVEIPRIVWNPILHGIILNTRPKHSAAKYAKIWTNDGSPLKVHTHQQTQLLRGYIGDRFKSPLVVDYAMRYGNPSISSVMQSLVQQQCDRILVFPLFPQYSASATASIFDEVFRFLGTLRNVPAVRTIKSFHDDPRYIKALAHSVRDYWMKNGRTKKLIMSFHGTPKFSLLKGDPYHCQCQKTGRLLAEELGLDEDQYLITFQSRFGRAEWLKPYTATTLQELGTQKLERVDVICPGFVSDCLETLEEIAIENKAIFLKAGGGAFHYIPCLNERPEWLHALTNIAIDNLHGWITTDWDVSAADNELKTSRLRALALGAKE